MTTNKILAIGGPKNFEFVPDYGWRFVTIAPTKLSPIVFQIDDNLIDIPESISNKRVTYRLMKLGDNATGANKHVYVVEGMSDHQAVLNLKDWLLKHFINMEDVTD